MSLDTSSQAGVYDGVYAAKVYITNDPQGKGRIQMWIPQIFGAVPVKIWAPPLVPSAVLPDQGDVIWCMFAGGDPAYPVYFPNAVIGKVPLPDPVTTGSTIQTFIDCNGDTWVAKNGVDSGNWNRATDVLHARVYRLASWQVQQAQTAVPWDQKYYDSYGIWNGGSGLVALIPGLWRYDTTVSATYGAQNYAMWLQPCLNGGRADFATTGPSAGGWQPAHAHGVWKMNANDVFTVTAAVSQAITTGGGGNDLTHAELHYVGTG